MNKKIKKLENFDVNKKIVLVRCDFNVPFDNEGEIEDDFRIKKALPTIKYLIKEKAQIVLMSHLGRPNGKRIEKYSLRLVAERLSELLDQKVDLTPDCTSRKTKKMVKNLNPGEVLLLENVQFHSGEKENDPSYVKELAQLGDIFILEAFGQSHRSYASISGISKEIPAGAGFLMEEELNNLDKIREPKKTPYTAILGGAKLSTKVELIKKILKKCDHFLLGGKVANILLRTKGLSIGKLIPEGKEEIQEDVKEIDLTNPKLHLPTDVVVGLILPPEKIKRESGPGSVRKREAVLDIGPETIKMFGEIIKESEVILWNGPLGYFEKEEFAKGTKEVANLILKNKKALKIVGGGDTVYALGKFGLRDKFDHVSTGGGAMLSYISGEELPGIKALKVN